MVIPVSEGDRISTTKELRILNANMWRYLEHSQRLLQGKGRNGIDTISEKTYWIRELLRDVVLILVNTEDEARHRDTKSEMEEPQGGGAGRQGKYSILAASAFQDQEAKES